MLKWIENILNKKLEREKQKLIKLKWQQAELERKLEIAKKNKVEE